MASAGGIVLSTSSATPTTIFDVTATGAGAPPNVATVANDSASGDSVFLFVNGEANYSQVIPPGSTGAVVCNKGGGIQKLTAYAGPTGTTTVYFAKIKE